MVMSIQEIVVRYKQAKHKNQQVNILADLNDCTKQEIVDALIEGGINKVTLTRIKGVNLNQTRPDQANQESEKTPEKTQKAPEKTPEAAEETQEVKEEVEKVEENQAEQNEELEKEIEEKDEKIKVLEENLYNARGEINELKKEVSRLKSRNFNEAVDNMICEGKCKDEIASLKSELEKLSSKNGELMLDYSCKCKECEKLEEEIEFIKSDLKEKSSELVDTFLKLSQAEHFILENVVYRGTQRDE